MKLIRVKRPSPAAAIAGAALFAALGGTSYAAGSGVWASHLGGLPASDYMQSKHYVSSHGVHFLSEGQNNVVLGRAGHFTFLASCQRVTDPTSSKPEAQTTFTVVANTYASLDGNSPVPAGTVANPPIHQDSDSLDSTAGNTLSDGQYAQTPSASTSTEIAADGQEVDVFYVDGVNWPAGSGSSSHQCFAGYNGFLNGGSKDSSMRTVVSGKHF
jgi:hypothetical protein